MQQTLLEMTQDILASMSSDNVNSISDTEESSTVARLIRQAYFELIDVANLPEHYDFFELTATDSDTPVIMSVPSTVAFLDWVKYDNATTDEPSPSFVKVDFLPLDEFIDRMYFLDTDEDYIDTFTLTVGSASVNILHYNDRFPKYYTTANDSTLLFDAYDSEEDSNLVANKTLCYGRLIPTFSLVDGFTPDLDPQQFQILFNEAKALAFAELKQMENPKADRNAMRHRRYAQKSKRKVEKFTELDRLPNYGWK